MGSGKQGLYSSLAQRFLNVQVEWMTIWLRLLLLLPGSAGAAAAGGGGDAALLLAVGWRPSVSTAQRGRLLASWLWIFLRLKPLVTLGSDFEVQKSPEKMIRYWLKLRMPALLMQAEVGASHQCLDCNQVSILS